MKRLRCKKIPIDICPLCVVQALESHRLKLGDTHPHTLESWNSLIDLYEAWNKPEEAEEWRAKLPKAEAVEE